MPHETLPAAALPQAERDRLRGLAERATPGPWEFSAHAPSPTTGDWATFEDEHGIYPPLGESGPVAMTSGAANAEYIAACSPAVVRSLLDALDAGDRQQQDQGKTENDQQQEPEPKGESPVCEGLPRISFDYGGRDVWHTDCAGQRHPPPMKHLKDRLPIGDGVVLYLYECTACRVRVFGGCDRSGRMVRRSATGAL